MSHDHDHTQDHAHVHRNTLGAADPLEEPFLQDAQQAAVRDLIDKGLTAEDVRRQVEKWTAATPASAKNGSSRVARPRVQAAHARRRQPGGEEIGIAVGPTKLVVVENTPSVHNLIVCTLCSCYPRMVLGLPPDWYKSRNYRSRVVREPRAVLAEFGTVIPEDVLIRVHDSTADMRYLVAPRRPKGTENWSEAELARLVTRDSMIGVALADTA
jgi:nitrile hydratase